MADVRKLPADPAFALMRVDAIRVSDMVDLEGDQYADPDETDLASPWPFEYGAVVDLERETPDCIRLDFHNGESAGFPPNHMLKVHRLTEADL